MTAFIGPVLGGLAGLLGGASSSRKETKMQKTQRKLIDQLLSSLNGGGQFGDLFNASPEAFQKSFVEPAQSLFRNQIAPQIQQQFIASGQQRGTGLDDTLTRAGVDLDAMLNQQMYQFQQDAMNRKQNVIGSILGQGSGAPRQPSTTQNVLGGIGGYLTSPDATDQLKNLLMKYGQNSPYIPQRKGFEQTY